MLRYVSVLFLLISAITPMPALAQSTTDFTLNDGRVHFQADPAWISIMEKKSGVMQAMIFQVPDHSAVGSNDTASVTIKTHAIKDAREYAAMVQAESLRSRQQTGYQLDSGKDDSDQHRYFVTRSSTRYLILDTFLQVPGVAVQVRCQRPLLAATTAAWTSAFDAACDKMVHSVKPGGA